MGASLIQALHPTAAAELSEAGGEGRVATPVGGRRFHASDVMDSHEARTVLGEAICRYRAMTYEELQRLLKEQDCFGTRRASGVAYQIAVEAVWDNKPGGNLRVLVHVDDGGLRAFVPLTEDFIMAPDGSFIGE